MEQSIDDARSRAAAAMGSAERPLEPGRDRGAGPITRPLASRSLVAATERVAGWMRDAALEARTDPIGIMSRASGVWRMNR